MCVCVCGMHNADDTLRVVRFIAKLLVNIENECVFTLAICMTCTEIMHSMMFNFIVSTFDREIKKLFEINKSEVYSLQEGNILLKFAPPS